VASLLVKPAGGKPFRVSLDSGAVTVGRASANRVTFADDPKVSREHCRIERRGTAFVVVDLGTSNGTRVGGKKIAGQKELWHKDIIGVGAAKILYEDPSRPRAGLASGLVRSIAGIFGRGSAEGPAADDSALLAKGRMRCPQCGTVLNISGKAPGDRVGCPRCRTIHHVPRGG